MPVDRVRVPSKKAQENVDRNGLPVTPCRTPYARKAKANTTKKTGNKCPEKPNNGSISADEGTPTPKILECKVILNAKWMWKNDKSNNFYAQESGHRDVDDFDFRGWWARCIKEANEKAGKQGRKQAQFESAYAELRHAGSGSKKDNQRIKLEGFDQWEDCRKVLHEWVKCNYKSLQCNIDILFTIVPIYGEFGCEDHDDSATDTSGRLVIPVHSHADCRLQRKRTSSINGPVKTYRTLVSLRISRVDGGAKRRAVHITASILASRSMTALSTFT